MGVAEEALAGLWDSPPPHPPRVCWTSWEGLRGCSFSLLTCHCRGRMGRIQGPAFSGTQEHSWGWEVPGVPLSAPG